MAARHGRKYLKDEEEVLWDVMEEKSIRNSSPKLIKPFKNSSMIPRSSSSSSAPMEIPDWSKIYGKTIKKKKNGNISTSGVDNNDVKHDGYYANDGFHHHHLNGYYNDDGDVHDDDYGHGDDDDMVPPHEFLARKLARSEISSFSVCEGIGRTLKGRDLSKVRNAILTKTGFLE